MTFLQLRKKKQSRDTKQFNSDGIAPVHAQSVALVSKHDPLKAFIQLPRNIKNRTIAHFTPYFAFFVIFQSILYRESPQNRQFLFCDQTTEEKHKITPWIT